MDEVLKHAENIESIGQMLSRIGEDHHKKDSFEMNEEDCLSFEEEEHLSMRESPKGCEDMPLPSLANKENIDINDLLIREGSIDKVLCASEDAGRMETLQPCGTCGRSFNLKALERHLKICEKVSSTHPRKVFDVANIRTKDMESVPRSPSTPLVRKRSSNKPEDDFKTCPHCARKFGAKPFDRHLAWCGEKSMRLQDSPRKDMMALAKLHARNTYRPKTPSRKGSGGSTSGASPAPPYRKDSMSSSCYTPTVFDRLSVSRKGSNSPPSMTSLSRSKSLRGDRRSSGISSLNAYQHTNETDNTNFIRSATGRGSIKRGPAPTKSSVLREQAKEKERLSKGQQCRPSLGSIRQNAASPLYASSRYNPSSLSQRVTSPGGYSLASTQGYMSSSLHRPSISNISQQLVKPSVVRPLHRTSSFGMRREPEGIEHIDSESPKTYEDNGTIIRGSYDHSQEYDPYQSAAKQMQELLFGITSSNASSTAAANLRPSTNSAFQKYIPGNDVPSTADINNKFGGGSSMLGSNVNQGGKSRLDSYGTLPSSTRRSSGWDGNTRDSIVSSHGGPYQTPSMPSSNSANQRSLGQSRLSTTEAGAKVARFCHECGNPFAMPNIRFCCECGVKRLYC